MSLPEDPLRLVAAALLALLWVVWTWRVLARGGDGAVSARGAKSPGSADSAGSKGWVGVSGSGSPRVLVAFASQTGVAVALARRAADRLRASGLSVRLESLGRLGPDDLLGAGRALFLVSTCGEGDPPDEAFGFVRRMSLAGPRLEPLDFAVLALGDRKYPNFCAFGRRLESWLLERGARPLAERIDVDGDDRAALGRWESEVLRLAGAGGAGAGAHEIAGSNSVPGADSGADAGRGQGLAGLHQQALQMHEGAEGAGQGSDWTSPPFEASAGEWALPGHRLAPWRLVDRAIMNSGSLGEPILRLRLEPIATGESGESAPSELPVWEPGDLAQVEVPGEPLVLRDYSIASLPEEGRIELFVRLQRQADGRLGRASHWWSAGLGLGETLRLRLRENRGFRLVARPDAPVILIGTGSGLAGLFALIKARERAGAPRNWLIFGDRNRAHDFLCREEIERWKTSGVLERFDAAFSRDGSGGAERRYVQHCMHEQAGALREWVRDGATIHVCGSLERVGRAVDEALVQILGDDQYALLRESGRYRRDVW